MGKGASEIVDLWQQLSRGTIPCSWGTHVKSVGSTAEFRAVARASHVTVRQRSRARASSEVQTTETLGRELCTGQRVSSVEAGIRAALDSVGSVSGYTDVQGTRIAAVTVEYLEDAAGKSERTYL